MMNWLPFSVWGDPNAGIGVKLLWGVATILCVLFVVWLYHYQKGINLTKAKSEPANKARKIPNFRNSNSQLPDTASAPLNNADIISPDAYPATKKDTRALTIQDNHLNTNGIVTGQPDVSQSQKSRE